MDKIILSESDLRKIYPHSSLGNRYKYLPWINYFSDYYEVNTIERIAAFLAQIGHESGQLKYVEEIASGKAYEGRKDLGNIFRNDGPQYKGRGLIQITGRTNYKRMSEDLNIDFEQYPKLLTEPQYAVLSAYWYWQKNNLNQYATLKETDFKTLTRKINGGLNGYADRVNIWNSAKDVLSKI